MKVIELSEKILFIDDIIQIYHQGNEYIEYFVVTKYGSFKIHKEDYNKIKEYLLSLNDEIEIIEDTPKEETKIPEKLDIYWELQKLIEDNNDNIDKHNLHKLLTKIEIKQNEIIDYLKSKGE